MKPYGWCAKMAKFDPRGDYATTPTIWKRIKRAARKAERRNAKNVNKENEN